MMVCLAFLILSAYLILIASLAYGNFSYAPKRKKPPEQKVSVVIPFRNEANRLPGLIDSLNTLDYPEELFEVIFVDDHSEDDGAAIICSKLKLINYKVISLINTTGKKAGILSGVKAAANNVIATTDADCVLPAAWLTTMMSYFEAERPHLLLGPVKLYAANGWFYQLQQLEFAALISSAAGGVGINHAFMGNAANLVFQKNLYLGLSERELVFEEASGDDVFLLHAIKKKYSKSANIRFATHQSAVVQSFPATHISDFLHQRIRWSAKAKHYKDKFTIMTALVIFLGNTCLAVLGILAVFKQLDWTIPLFYYFIKTAIDYLLLRSTSNWQGIKIKLPTLLLLSFVYPFYFILLALLSLPFKLKWKGRKI